MAAFLFGRGKPGARAPLGVLGWSAAAATGWRYDDLN
jgi:hypothetical protein